MRLLLIATAFLIFAVPASAGDSPYETVAKWDCSSPCTITYSIDSAYPERSASLVREVYRDISQASEIEFVEVKNGKVRWETCETTRSNLCGFWTRFTLAKGQGRDFATLRSVEVIIDTTTWDQLSDLKRYLCHEALHTVGFEHAPRNLPSCFNGTSWEPGVEDYTLISMMYGG